MQDPEPRTASPHDVGVSVASTSHQTFLCTGCGQSAVDDVRHLCGQCQTRAAIAEGLAKGLSSGIEESERTNLVITGWFAISTAAIPPIIVGLSIVTPSVGPITLNPNAEELGIIASIFGALLLIWQFVLGVKMLAGDAKALRASVGVSVAGIVTYFVCCYMTYSAYGHYGSSWKDDVLVGVPIIYVLFASAIAGWLT